MGPTSGYLYHSIVQVTLKSYNSVYPSIYFDIPYLVQVVEVPDVGFTDIGFFADIGPDVYPILQNNIAIYQDRRQTSTTSFPMWNQYRNIPRSSVYDLEAKLANHTISGPPAPMPRRQPPSAGRAGRHRATAQAFQQVQPLDPRHSRTSCRPGGLPSIHRAAATQATAENSVKLEKLETLNNINVSLS